MIEIKSKDVVVLRNGQHARVIGLGLTSKNVLVGQLSEKDTKICWHSSGKWRWDEKDSSLDIVSLVDTAR